MIRRGPFNRPDKVIAWCLAAVFTICGSIGLGIAVAKMHLYLGIIAVGALAIGVLWAVAAMRGRPVEWLFRRRIPKPN